MTTDEKLQQAYDTYAKLTDDLLVEHEPLVLAGVMAAQAFTLYKTVLTPEDYESIMTNIFQSRDSVKTIPRPILQ